MEEEREEEDRVVEEGERVDESSRGAQYQGSGALTYKGRCTDI